MLEIIEKLKPLFCDFAISDYRFCVMFGGRGGGKTQAVADWLILCSLGIYNIKDLENGISTNAEAIKILCTREYQSSIKDSVHAVITRRINELGLSELFTITRDEIKSVIGSTFIFKGITKNISEIKSTDNIKFCWVEEAERVTKNSWNTLTPTIRAIGSKIIITFNPESADNETYQRFIVKDRDDTLKININYDDNPFLPLVLKDECEYDKKYNYERYKNVWCGEPVSYSDSIVFKNKFSITDLSDYINSVDNKKHKLLFGLDFGYSNDPTALICCFIKDSCLYIIKEVYLKKLEIRDMHDVFKNEMQELNNNKIYADCSAPQTISHLKNEGLNIEGAKKYSGSVAEGVAFIKSFKHIYIHHSCKNTILEFQLYSYKVNKTTGQILTDLVDANNHAIDAIRYALNDFIMRKNSPLVISNEFLDNFNKKMQQIYAR